VTTSGNQLAEKLLASQVEFVIAEMTGERLVEVIERDVNDILGLVDRIVVSDAVSREHVKATARKYVEMVGDSPLIELMATEIADAVYVLAAADEHELGEVIGRDHVEALVKKVLGMQAMRDRALERLGESPVVATVASWFVNKIVTDFLRANADRAERVPGVGQLFGVGRRAAGTVRGQADRHLGDVLGDVAGRGAQLALRRLNVAIRETMDEAPLHDAAMEVWDLHAEEPVSTLREYLTQEDLRELVSIVHEIWLTLRDTEYFAAAVDAGIDVFFDNYGSFTVGGLLAELGVERDQLVADAKSLVPPAIDAIKGTGLLEGLVRARLEPFWRSEAALGHLTEAAHA
jgi:ribosomal silencing factor RsfS